MASRHPFVPPLLVFAAAACGDSTGIAPEQLAGTWTATEIVMTNQADPTQTADLIAAGVTFTLTIRADSTFTMTVVEPGAGTDTDIGMVSVSGNVLTIAESGQGSPTPFTAVRNGDTLTLTTTDEEFDFDEDGVEEAATMRIVLRRN